MHDEEEALARVNAELEAAVRRRDGEAYRRLYAEKLLAERRAQSVAGGEFAVPLEGVDSEFEASGGIVLGDGLSVLVVCPVPSKVRPLQCAAVFFSGVHEYRVARLYDDVAGHRLFGKGLDHCQAFEVMNSEWLKSGPWAEENPATRHFVLCFKDSVVEALCKSIEWGREKRDVNDWIASFKESSVAIGAILGVSRGSKSPIG